MSGIKNPEGAKAYLIKHGMHQFFEQLANKLLTEQPEDPLAFVEAEVPAMATEWREKAAAKQKQEEEGAAAEEDKNDDAAKPESDEEKKKDADEPAAAAAASTEEEKKDAPSASEEEKKADDEPAAADATAEAKKDDDDKTPTETESKPDAELVTESWGWVKPADGDLKPVGKLFYETLFEQSPGLLDTVFKGTDREAQAGKLMTMIDAAVGLLGDTEKLVPVLNALGERHAGYGVEDEHYPIVAKALLTTLEKGLGDKLTEAHKTAWANIYGVIEGEMKKGAATEQGQRLAADYKARQETKKDADEPAAATEEAATKDAAKAAALSEDEAALRIQRTQRQRAAKAEVEKRRAQ